MRGLGAELPEEVGLGVDLFEEELVEAVVDFESLESVGGLEMRRKVLRVGEGGNDGHPILFWYAVIGSVLRMLLVG